MDATRLEEIDSVVKDAINNNITPGAVVLVAKGWENRKGIRIWRCTEI